MASISKAIKDSVKTLLGLTRRDPEANHDHDLLAASLCLGLDQIASVTAQQLQYLHNLKVHPDYSEESFARCEAILSMVLAYIDNQVRLIQTDPETFLAVLAEHLLNVQEQYQQTELEFEVKDEQD